MRDAGVTFARTTGRAIDAPRTGTSSTAATSAPTARITRRPTSRGHSSRGWRHACPSNLLLVDRRARGDRRSCAALDVYTPRHAVGPLLGRDRYVPGPALRGLLLPGDGVLHRARASRASRAARKASTSWRAGCCPSPRTRCTRSATRGSPTPLPTTARASVSTSRTRSTNSRNRVRSATPSSRRRRTPRVRATHADLRHRSLRPAAAADASLSDAQVCAAAPAGRAGRRRASA